MALTRQQREQALEWLRDFFESDLTRLALSMLIILSMLPFGWVNDYSMVFFFFFSLELGLRLTVLHHDLKRRAISRVEVLFFVLDAVATLSFLPIEALYDDVRYLRLFRLSRMVLLLGYWGPIVREVWFILMKRERRYQIFFVLISSLILSFISAILLSHFQSQGVDFNEDGNLLNDSSFWAMLWWSFRQIHDPGNMIKDPTASVAFFFSLGLTIAGMFVFSFLIGIGSSVVEELVKLGKERRLGMRRHTVICNLSPYSRVLLEELVTYYTKSLRSPRIVTMGAAPARYGYMLEGPCQRVRYREGRPLSRHDLLKVDVDRATRVILLAQRDRTVSDSEAVSQILSVREVNARCDIYAELYRPQNVRAALEAGGGRTVPILADRMVGLFMASIVVFPGIQELYWELLTSVGDEIYTCLFDRGAMSGRRAPSGAGLPFGELLERGHRAHGVVLLGYLLKDDDATQGFTHVLNPGSPRPHGQAAPPAVPPVDRLAGYFGVSDHFERLRGFTVSLPDVAAARSADASPEHGLRLGLCPSATGVQRILICGFHNGIVDFCEQLILFSGAVTIFIMVPEQEQVEQVTEAFIHRVREEADAARPEEPGTRARRVLFSCSAPGRLGYTVQGSEERGGKVRVICGDWSEESFLLDHPKVDYHLNEMDAVLLTYAEQAADPDARTALGLLKLIRLRETTAGALKQGARIVCEVQSTEKAELFQRRFSRPDDAAGHGCRPVTIVPAKRMRNAILAQSVFVPGIVNIFSDLLCESGQEICKLIVDRAGLAPDEDQQWTFTQLLAALYQQDGMVLVGLELEDAEGGNRRVVVNPRAKEEDYSFTLGQLVSIFALGDTEEMGASSSHCAGCRLPKE